MTINLKRVLTIATILSMTNVVMANAEGGNSDIFTWLLVGLGVAVLVAAILTVSDNLLQIEAKSQGVNTDEFNYSIFPKMENLFSRKSPEYTVGTPVVKLKKGHDIKLVGKASNEIVSGKAKRYAIKPANYRGISPIPKVVVTVGDTVKAGDEIFFDKKNPEVKYVAPVSGEVVEIRRGAKRAITAVVILADKEMEYKIIDSPSLNATREELVDFMQESGLWPLINQRPFDIIANPAITPRDIFVSTFDTAPLAANMDLIISGNEESFQKGLDVLAQLTDGRVYLGLDGNGVEAPSSAFTNAKNCEKTYFEGPHPSGNVGIQIHHTAPINNGDVVWTLGVQDVITIGDVFYKGRYNGQRVVALTGEQLDNPVHVKTHIGANIGELLEGNLNDKTARLISGNVLTGEEVDADNFLNIKDTQVTTMEEGDDYEMFGWLLPITPRPSVSRTLPGFLMPDFEYSANGNTHGEKRAFVMTGQYENMIPMDVYPQHLMKAILSGNIEKMEGLGINELSEEDIALCEFACTSKQPLQAILRDGMDMMIEQG